MFLLYQCTRIMYKIPIHVPVASMSLYITSTCFSCINVIIKYWNMLLLYQYHYRVPVHAPVVSMSLYSTVHIPVVSMSLYSTVHVLVLSMSLYSTGTCSCFINVTI